MAALLSDNFNDNSLDTAKWDVAAIANQNVSVTVSETGGQLVITPLASTASTNRNGLTSDSTFNMTQGYAVWNLAQKAGANASVETRCGVYLDASNYLSFEVANTVLTFRKRASATNSDTTTTYNATNHKWLMLVHCGGVAMWLTSADAITWTVQRFNVAPGFAVTALKMFLDAGTTASVATITPTTSIFDDVQIGTLEISAPFEQHASFGGYLELDIDPGFPMNIDVEGVQGESFTIPMGRRYSGDRITAATTILTWRATATGEIDTFDIWLGSANPSATSIIFNLKIDGEAVFSGLGRPTIASGQSHVQKTAVGAAVALGDLVEVTVEQVPSVGIAPPIDVNARVLVG